MKETPASVGRGIWLVALGRAEGIGCFRGTPSAFFTSLAPMLTFSVMAAALLAARGNRHAALVQLLTAPASVLAAPVASHFVAVRLEREPNWARYATAANWSQWVYLVLILAALSLGKAGLVMAPFVVIYAIWVQLFLARAALALGWGRAVLVVLAVMAANGVFVLGPAYLVSLFARPGG